VSASPPPPGSSPGPDGQLPPSGPGPGEGEREPRRSGWIWPVFGLIAALGVLAGVLASDNKANTPTTTVNQQTISTTNSLGVSIQAPKPAETTTVTAPAKTVTAPAQTVTAPPPAKTTPEKPAKTDTTATTPSP
jgi:hypothetical protein